MKMAVSSSLVEVTDVSKVLAASIIVAVSDRPDDESSKYI
jgi:hypothetical protein